MDCFAVKSMFLLRTFSEKEVFQIPIANKTIQTKIHINTKILHDFLRGIISCGSKALFLPTISYHPFLFPPQPRWWPPVHAVPGSWPWPCAHVVWASHCRGAPPKVHVWPGDIWRWWLGVEKYPTGLNSTEQIWANYPLKPAASLHLEMDGWNTIRLFLFGMAHFQGRTVSFRECIQPQM